MRLYCSVENGNFEFPSSVSFKEQNDTPTKSGRG